MWRNFLGRQAVLLFAFGPWNALTIRSLRGHEAESKFKGFALSCKTIATAWFQESSRWVVAAVSRPFPESGGSTIRWRYSRNLIFEIGGDMDLAIQALIDRNRLPPDLKTIKTILDYQRRLHYLARRNLGELG
jgi:hypothetical protein